MSRKRRFVPIFSAFALLTFPSCGTLDKRDGGADAAKPVQSSKPTQPAQKDAGQKVEAQLAEARNLIEMLSSRIETLETKLSSMNDKVDATRTSIDNLTGIKKPVTTGVLPHPARHRGAAVEAPSAKSDPESGFTNDSAVSAYRQAIIMFEARKYPESVLAFSSFLERYADHALAGAAQYHIGESYFRQKEYKLSHQEFQRVLTAYDRSSHVPETLKRMAEIAEIMKQPEAAAKYRHLLTSLFPQSPAAEGVLSAQSTGGKPTSIDGPPATAPAPSSHKTKDSHHGNEDE